MEPIEDYLKFLPKEDFSKASNLLKKGDMYNLGYLVWADLSRAKRGDIEANTKKLEELNSMLANF